VAIDPTDHSYYYACFQPSPPAVHCASFHDANGRTTQTSFQNTPRTGPPDTPLALDPNDPAVVYVGGTTLGRSTDRGAHFRVISPADAAHSLPGPGAITAIAPTTTAPDTLYAGTDTGRLWRTTDLGAHWTRLAGTPARWVTAIVVDPTDADHVYAAFSGYRDGDDAANVFETTDGGASWRNISLDLPNGPVEAIAYDQPRHVLYAATDYGLFGRAGDAAHWSDVGARGLPRVPVMDVKLSGDGRVLYAATSGRSVWRLPLPFRLATTTP
jgi:hypothetical protein